ncbi:MAG: hypothetical protein QXP71_02295 [Desulfurococcaceae archaeon]
MNNLIFIKTIFTIFLTLIIVSTTYSVSTTLQISSVNKIVVESGNQLILPAIDGDFTEWLQFSDKIKLHPIVKTDGLINDWYTEYYVFKDDRITRDKLSLISNKIMVVNESENYYLYYKGEFIWFDKINDVRSGFENYPSVDIVEFRVTGDSTYLHILIRVRDLGIVGDPENPSLLLSIPIDIDMNPSNGNFTTIDPYTRVSSYAYWDYQIVIDLTNPSVKPNQPVYGDGKNMRDGGSPLDILNPEYIDVSTNKSLFVCNPATDSIEISIAWSDINVTKPWEISNIRFYVMTFLGNGYGVPITNLSGSQVLDVLSNQSTDDEVYDQVIDYWIDIGFTIACEPIYYNHYILDDKGYIQAFTDLSSDYRNDYIPNEAFDTDLLTAIIWIDTENNALYLFIHIKGFVKPLNNVSPSIAIVTDITPSDLNDGVDSWIHIPPGSVQLPPGKNYTNLTETELGIPKTLNTTSRSAYWTNIIWIFSKIENGVEKYLIYSYNGTIQYVSNVTIKASDHFIEATLPLDKVNPALAYSVFRLEILVFAYVLETSLMPNIPINTILDPPGSNVYDVLSPFATWSPVGIEIVYDKPYAILGEIYDIDNNPFNDLEQNNGDHWIDSFHTRKYSVRIINLELSHISFDNDTLIEIGEPAWINATIEYYNGFNWKPLVNRSVSFYLLNNITYELIYVGSNYSDVNGSIYLFLDNIASRVKSGYYYLIAVFEPVNNDELIYPRVVNKTNTVYAIINQPFVTVMNEPYYMPFILLIITILLIIHTVLRNRRKN